MSIKYRDPESGEWVSVGTIPGPPGEQGPIGPQGPQGPQGERGATGIHVGTDAPTDPEVGLWLDTDEETESASGESKWELINEVVTTEEVSKLEITTDTAGNPFDLDEIHVVLYAKDVANTSASWYTYVNELSSFNVAGALTTNVTVTLDYQKSSGYMKRVTYQYGYVFRDSVIVREPFNANGKYTPQNINRFKIQNFENAVLPIGTHVAIYGRRAST